MVPSSRTPGRGVSTRIRGYSLLSVWQEKTGILQAQTSIHQRERNRARGVKYRSHLPFDDAGIGRFEAVSYNT